MIKREIKRKAKLEAKQNKRKNLSQYRLDTTSKQSQR